MHFVIDPDEPVFEGDDFPLSIIGEEESEGESEEYV
jgi:hypothetical protein